MNRLMNYKINHKAVYRTAPATPGLLINHKAVYRTAPATPGLLMTCDMRHIAFTNCIYIFHSARLLGRSQSWY